MSRGSGGAAWRARLVAAVPREEIPAFLTELQALVQALRDDADWCARLTPRLCAWPDLTLGYLDARRDEVAAALAKHP